jgi:hypothetical protein
MRTDRGALLLLAVLPAVAASADEVYLKSGGQFSGRITSRTDTFVEMDIGAGKIGVPMSSVLRIEEGRSALQEYEDRAGRLAPGDLEGWTALAEWAADHGLGTQASEAWHRVLNVSPDDVRANAALGRVKMNGRWMSEDESYAARGYVRFEGDWVTPAEHEAILRERSAADERDRAEARARDAEARAREAEARAREAETAAAQQEPQLVGLPLWYGWGAGPAVWPAHPAQPIKRPVPRTVPVYR